MIYWRCRDLHIRRSEFVTTHFVNVGFVSFVSTAEGRFARILLNGTTLL